MSSGSMRFRYGATLLFLVLSMLLLSGRLVYLVISDAKRFPINTVKIAASYDHITRVQLEKILSPYLLQGFFGFSAHLLKNDLQQLGWCEDASVQRIWPDVVKITVVERIPIAVWNKALMTESGEVFQPEAETNLVGSLPHLQGPEAQKNEVLQNFQKLSKLLSSYGLSVSGLRLRNNQAWELLLKNGILLRLGKNELETRVKRFCRAYPAVFADKPEQLTSVDLRYARGMAVQWKPQTGR